jgi:hypothetical protein
MSDTAKNIVEGFRTMRVFCNEAAKMLKTADGMMEEGGWTPTNNKVVGYSSKVFDPDWWLPTVLHRYYERVECPHILAYVAILLDDLENDTSRISESLLTAGSIDYGHGNKRDKNLTDLICLQHLWNKNSKDDGTLHIADGKEIWEDETPAGSVSVKTFAYPLDEILSSEVLKEKIIQPLLKILS